MKNFSNKIAVITGGGNGIGQALCIELAMRGAHIAFCDINQKSIDNTIKKILNASHGKIKVTGHLCDVSNEEEMLRFRDEVIDQHNTQYVNLVFNNAGIGGGNSFINGSRDEWEKTFNISWYGVYYGCRVFTPLLIASNEGYLINTSSVNGFWASIGPKKSLTAYSSAKFAIKGLTEALVNDFRLNAPHVKVAVVMPGHIGTSNPASTASAQGIGSPLDMSSEAVAVLRSDWESAGRSTQALSDDDIRRSMQTLFDDFKNKAPTTSEEAAEIILDGIRNQKWRILVGEDAKRIDQLVRENPEGIYERAFMDQLTKENVYTGLSAFNSENQ